MQKNLISLSIERPLKNCLYIRFAHIKSSEPDKNTLRCIKMTLGTFGDYLHIKGDSHLSLHSALDVLLEKRISYLRNTLARPLLEFCNTESVRINYLIGTKNFGIKSQ